MLKFKISYSKKCKFVTINFLRMIRIGIIGTDRQLLSVITEIKAIYGIEITGCFSDNYNCTKEFSADSGIVPYPTLEALFRYVDAVIINFDVSWNVLLIAKCLKSFKHVFSVDAKSIKFKECEYLEKIAEESNVKFYPEFGNSILRVPEKLQESFLDFQYINIHHNLNYAQGGVVGERLSFALLQDLSSLLGICKTNVKRVNASGWNFCEPGLGMINARLDFENGSIINFMISSIVAPYKFQATLFTASIKAEMIFENGNGRIITHPISGGISENILISFSEGESLSHSISLFISSIHQKTDGLRALENQFRAIRINNIIREKINNFSSKNILYS